MIIHLDHCGFVLDFYEEQRNKRGNFIGNYIMALIYKITSIKRIEDA